MYRSNQNSSQYEQMHLCGFFLLDPKSKKDIENGWFHTFREDIFPLIDPSPLAVMYSEKSSRPCSDLKILLGAFLLAFKFKYSWDQMVCSVQFDIRWRYALHILEQPGVFLCRRTVTRFLTRLGGYMKEHENDPDQGDLLREVFNRLTKELVRADGVDTKRIRIDSTLISSYVRSLSRFELLYVCNSNLASLLNEKGVTLPAELAHYLEEGDQNAVCYHHAQDVTRAERMKWILKESLTLLGCTPEELRKESDYRNLARAVAEQAWQNSDGVWEFKTSGTGGEDEQVEKLKKQREKKEKNIGRSNPESMKTSPKGDSIKESDPSANVKGAQGEPGTDTVGEVCAELEAAFSSDESGFSMPEGLTYREIAMLSGVSPDGEMVEMSSEILQSPYDTDATFRFKYEKSIGFSWFWGEASNRDTFGNGDDTPSVAYILYYQAEKNIYSDASFMADLLEDSSSLLPNGLTIAADGGFSYSEETAEKKGAKIFNTNLVGKKPSAFFAGFKLSGDRKSVVSCPNGQKPVKCSMNEKTGQMTLHFEHACCQNCPHREECNPTGQKKYERVITSAKTIERAEKTIFRSTEEFREISAFRNGTESVPSVLKNHYQLEKKQKRGLVNSRIMAGLSFMALNASRHCDYALKKIKSGVQGESAPKIA